MTLKKIACMILMSALFVLSVTSCAFGNNNTGAKTVESIEYVSGTVSASIKVGESLDTSNLKVKVTYSDGTTEQVSADKLTIGRIDTGVVGTHNLSVTYENKTIYVPVAVEATGSSSKPTVTAISNIRGFKTSLIIGEVFTADGITATVSFSDGTSKTVSASSGLTVFENVDTSKGGTYYVTVSYDGVISSPVSVTVRSAIIGIELDGSSFSTLLYHNDPVDTASIKFFVVYNDGTKEHITDTDALTVDTAAITTANIGDGSFTASYTVGDNTYNCTVPYSVQRKLLSIDVDESTISTEILLGGSVDTSRIVVTVTYSNGESETLSYADVQISNLNTSTIGEKQLTVRYLGYTDTVIVTVNPKLIGIAYAGEVLQFKHVKGVNADPEKTQERFAKYLEDGAFVFTLTYDTGEGYHTETKILSSFDEFDYSRLEANEVADEKYMNVVYGGFSADVAYTVTKYVSAITLSDSSAFNGRISHHKDADEVRSSIIMTVIYSDGTTAEVGSEHEQLEISNLDTDTVIKDAKISVSYSDKFGAASTEVPYDVYATFVRLEFADNSFITVYKPGQTVVKAETVAAICVYSDGTTVPVNAYVGDFELDTDTLDGEVATVAMSYTDEYGEIFEGSFTVEVLKVKKLEITGIDKYIPYWTADTEVPKGEVEELARLGHIKVLVTFANSLGEELSYEDETILFEDLDVHYDIDLTEQGAYEITAKTAAYGTARTKITVGVELVSIEIIKNDTGCFQFATAPLASLEIKAIYHDGTEKTLKYSAIMHDITVKDFDSSDIGTQEYTLVYTENEVSASDTWECTVWAPYDPETTDFRFTVDAVTIKIGEEFDYRDYAIFVVSGVEVTPTIIWKNDKVYNPENPKASIYTITASYQGLTAQMKLNVMTEIVSGGGGNVTDKNA